MEYGRDLGLQIWGVDASRYALAKSREVLGTAVNRVSYGDLTVAHTLPGGFDVVVTEDVYPMLDGDELQLAQENLHQCAPVVAHWITPSVGVPHPAIVTHLSAQEWADLVAPDEVLRRV